MGVPDESAENFPRNMGERYLSRKVFETRLSAPPASRRLGGAARWRLHPHEIEPGLSRSHGLDLHQRLAYGASRNGG
jgi:hypothetical protein